MQWKELPYTWTGFGWLLSINSVMDSWIIRIEPLEFSYRNSQGQNGRSTKVYQLVMKLVLSILIETPYTERYKREKRLGDSPFLQLDYSNHLPLR